MRNAFASLGRKKKRIKFTVRLSCVVCNVIRGLCLLSVYCSNSGFITVKTIPTQPVSAQINIIQINYKTVCKVIPFAFKIILRSKLCQKKANFTVSALQSKRSEVNTKQEVFFFANDIQCRIASASALLKFRKASSVDIWAFPSPVAHPSPHIHPRSQYLCAVHVHEMTAIQKRIV